MSLDYPDIGPVGDPGTITYGDFGPAREEVQKAAHSGENYNVKISVFNGTLVTKGIISEDNKIIYSWGKYLILSGPKVGGGKQTPSLLLDHWHV